MDKTIRTIRETITEVKNGVVPTIVLVVDTNILADIGWSRDQNTIRLIEHAAKFPMMLVCCPSICAIEFKTITQTEVESLKKFREDFNKVFHEIKRYEIGNVDKIIEGFGTIRGYFDELIDELWRAPLYVLDKLAPVLYIFDNPLPIQHTMSYYVSNDPEYDLQYKDALVFLFAKLVGKSVGHESRVIFLTKDMDFNAEKIVEELNEVGVEVYFSSGECLQRIKELLAYDFGIGAFAEIRIVIYKFGYQKPQGFETAPPRPALREPRLPDGKHLILIGHKLLLPDLRCRTTLRSRGYRSRLSADLCNGASLACPPCMASASG